jgi:probable HAF family extracellular repeat protein
MKTLLAVIGVIAVAAPAHALTYAVTDLGALGGTDSLAWAINNYGQVAGYAATTEDESIEAFLWTPADPNSPSGSMLGLESLHGTGSWATSINAGGQVAGVSFEGEGEDADEHATLWSPTTPNGATGTLHDLGTLGGTYSEAHGINDLGQVSGASDITGDGATHAFMWKPTTPGGVSGAMLDLGTLGGINSYGIAINTAGHVVGAAEVPAEVSNYSHAFLYTSSGGMVDLNTLIDPLSGWVLLDADGVNDSGQITGQGLIGEEYHARSCSRPFPRCPATSISTTSSTAPTWNCGKPASASPATPRSCRATPTGTATSTARTFSPGSGN